jgi:DNA-directed RNA polymerase subunit E'/Rpb7
MKTILFLNVKQIMIFKPRKFRFQIVLFPEDLSIHFQDVLLKKLKNLYEGKAIENYGLIESVRKIINIEEEKIMDPIPNVYFDIHALVTSYIPSSGDVISMQIEKIIPYGIFLQKPFFRVLIPLSNLDENVRIDTSSLSVIVKEEKKYKQDMFIDIQLQEIRFEKDGYNCLAKVSYN